MSDTNTSAAEQAYWNAVTADAQYKASENIGKYVLGALFILGCAGNMLSFAVMVQKKMRSSSTTFYMAALAIADTMVLVFGCLRRWVIEIFRIEILNVSPAACSVVNFLSYWSFDIAVWILVIMTLDKLIIVAYPMKARMRTRKTAIIALLIVIFICAGINAHIFFTTEYKDQRCTAKGSYESFYADVWPWVDAAVYSFVPFIVLLLMNIIIIAFVTRANQRRQNMTDHFRRSSNTGGSQKLTIMLLSITCAFLLLTAPTVVLQIIREKGKPYFDLSNPKDMAKYTLTRQISRVLLYLNHSINFFLYCVAGPKFRNELSVMLCCRSAKDKNRKSTMMSQSHTTATAFTASGDNPAPSRTTSQSEAVL